MAGVLTIMRFYSFKIEPSMEATIDFNIISYIDTESFLTFEPPNISAPLIWGPNYGRSDDYAPPPIPT